MKQLISSILLLFATLAVAAQCRFETPYPYYKPDNYATKTIATSDGGFLTVAGAYYDTTDPGWKNGQDDDMIIIKSDACGRTLWQTHYGYAHEPDDAVDAVETDVGDYLVLGNAFWQQQDANIRIVSYDKNGQLKWSKLYLGAVSSGSNCIFKHKYKSNTYVVGGSRSYSSSTVTRPTLFEINDTGKVLRFKDIGTTNCAMQKLFAPNDTSYLILGIGGDSLYLIETDTAFNLRRSRTLFTDTFGKMDRFYAAGLSYDGQSIAIAMETPLSNKPGSFTEDLLVKINLQGDLMMYKIYNDTGGYPNITYITPTPDNGYLIGAYLYYTDSNFNLMKYQRVYGAGFYSAVMNADGSVVLSGNSYKYDTVWGNVCVVRVDSLGNTAVNDLCEKQRVAFEVYPNPATDVLNIHTESKGTIQVELLNALGQRVYEGSVSIDTTISTAEYPQGIYFLRFMDDARGGVHTERIAVLK